ncbi:tRNA-splicing endonuclease subunit Sen15-like [Odontomachus brunneus]|uniref:tRNA-splicing endonuclease subunit Sen15-like n=1 Tax=Odontomachus brunneus TaxID=486640 RepID=UPI0013F22C2E|nr:tRNA-splicing endonuclease subunit Sen15-like [Odontomachus brunneus]
MYDICHPVYYELYKLGCSDPVKTSIAFYVYIELCEVKRFQDVNYKYNEELDLFYFEVKKNKNSSLEIYIPWASKNNISFSKIEKMQDVLQNERLTFVFKSEDSSSVFYTINKGLMKPASPETARRRREKEENKSNLETEIRKNTSHLYELAKSLSESSDLSCNANSDVSTESIKLIDIDSTKKHENSDITAEPRSADS